MRTWTHASAALIAGAVFAMAALPTHPALAQTDNNKKNETNKNETNKHETSAGPLQPPKPYGDRGTTTLGNPPIQYPTRPNSTRRSLEYWKSRIISGPGYYGNTVIIFGDSPCFVPFYYRYGLPGYYDNGFFVVGGQDFGPQYGPGPNQYNNVNGGPYPDSGYRQEQNYPRDSSAAAAQSGSGDDSEYYLHRKAKPKTALDKDPLLAE